jgi:eukaryotic-like serine/threonine-protein kinase
VNYSFIGRYEEALKEALEAVRLDPTSPNAAENVIDMFTKMKRLDEAKQKIEELRSKNPDSPLVHFNGYNLAILAGDQAGMEREFQWATGKFFESDMVAIRASVFCQAGQMKKGEPEIERASQMYQSSNRKENASQLITNLALAQAVYGDCQHARSSATEAMKLSRGKIDITSAAMAYAMCNAAPQSQSLIDEALKAYPKDTGVSIIGIPMTRALLELSRGNGAGAIQQLEPTRRYDLGTMTGLWNNYIRGLAYLQQRSGNEAAAEFQIILDHREIEVTSPLHPIAHLGLARAAALKGDLSQSRKEYQDLFAFWRNADADLPVLVQAKKEYEGLK